MSIAEKTPKSLPVKLSEEEMLAAGADLAAVCEEIEKLEEERKASASSFKGKIEVKEVARTSLIQRIQSGVEMREVLVFERAVHESLVVETVREDTGEVIDTRPMNGSDTQTDLLDATGEEGDGDGDD